ncbi:MAG TPA: ice-binding family protein [Gracilimonas sp.]|uniref:ice-binding family protein n=1 Tax=Gracilimonas sp. TaxID=1974203 RepID=UPI002DA5A603|nr:ice-binding family protein [Gracilimonas sp.]
MKKSKNFKLKYAISALFLMAFTAGCNDQMVGVEGYCPEVQSTFPANSATDVELDAVITVTFSGKMNPSTITSSSFTLSDNSSPAKGSSNNFGNVGTNNQAAEISGEVTYNDNTNTMSFTPDAPLSISTVYTGTVNTNVQDPLGNAMLEDYVWTFSTIESQNQGNLGTAETYGLMATSAITNIGNTIINGDVSLDPGTSMTGFPPGIVNGTININNAESAQARADLLDAYNYYKNLPPGTNVPAGADLGALYPSGIAPGTYTSGSTMLVSTTLVLDAGGDPNAVWVFQIGSSLTTGADITLANGANENNVFWVPTEDATIGVGTIFHGTIISGRDVTANTGAIINGRILAGAITAGTIALDGNTVNVPGF